jgi:O-methyltransferase involved in polyketide biosynthesis
MELDPLSRTALVPFWARVLDGRSDTPVLGDTAAVAMAERVAQRFGRLEVSESTRLGCCLRNRTMDEWVSAIASGPGSADTTVVDIGVGLDTRACRLSGIARRYVEIDGADILGLRDQWLPDTGAVRLAGDGMLVADWAGQLGPGRPPTVVVLEGVLTYQPPGTVAEFFAGLARHLPGSYVLFDSLAPWQAWMANRPAALAQGRPRYLWTARATRRIRAGTGRLRICQEKGFMDFPRHLTRPFGAASRALHAVPPLRRSYRLTFAQLPVEGR